MGEFGSEFEKELPISDRNFDTKMSPESEHTMNDLFRDDFDGVEIERNDDLLMDINPELEMKSLFADDFSEKTEDLDNNDVVNDTKHRETVDLTKRYEPNSKFEVDGKTNETDDNGYIYKIDGYELLPNDEYTIDGVTYKTDALRRIISCDGRAKSTPDGERDLKAQNMAGGDDRKPGDQGGHIFARIFGGAKGIENMLAMRGTAINQSVYKRMENEIAKALEDGKDVDVNVDVEYEGESQRPSKITVNYSIDGKETVVHFDNDEGSTDLVASLDGKIEDDDLNDLKQEIIDANKDGANISVVSIKMEYYEYTRITVTIRDDNSEHPVNEDRVYTQKESVNEETK